ncbi:MAG: hypothetical protein WBZ36_16620 [Candidatus Nitrosopolaris sp.]
MNQGVTSVVENPAAARTSRVMILAAVVLLSTAVLTMANLEYPYTLANATSMTNAEHIDATHNTHCDGDICQAVTCINNNCQSLSTRLNQLANQPQTSNQPYNQPQNQGLGSTSCYLPCLPSR